MYYVFFFSFKSLCHGVVHYFISLGNLELSIISFISRITSVSSKALKRRYLTAVQLSTTLIVRFENLDS